MLPGKGKAKRHGRGLPMRRFLISTCLFFKSIVWPLIRPIIKLLALIGKYLALALRAVYVFFYYLANNVNRDDMSWYRKEARHQFTLASELPFFVFYITTDDVRYALSCLVSPREGYRDFRRWRRRRRVRWAKPKIRSFVHEGGRDYDAEDALVQRNVAILRRKGGPMLGQKNPMDYISDDEEEEVVGDEKNGIGKDIEAGQNRGGDETGAMKPEIVMPVEIGPVKGMSIGRKEPKRVNKKKKKAKR